MPVLTEIQRYAADILRLLRCARRGQIHRLIELKYPSAAPEKIMRQISHVLRVHDDGADYLWPGADPDPGWAAAVGVMLAICKGSLPVIGEAPRYPRALLFFVPAQQSGAVLPYRVYTPREGDEAEYRAAAESERQPAGHACVFVISGKSRIPLLRVSHPHIFALARGDGTYEFLDAQVN
jgi:hypothetical protein